MNKKFFKNPIVIGAIIILAFIVIYFLFFNGNNSGLKKINCTSDDDCKKAHANTHCGTNGLCEFDEPKLNRTTFVIRSQPNKVVTGQTTKIN